ncbi:hypothetical protein BDZ89DRAFT_388107 [Hymenopellis radicata]|nr:hypothetical protein BDZ89DRAFT_388107 [Hymenopellis radicata]
MQSTYPLCIAVLLSISTDVIAVPQPRPKTTGIGVMSSLATGIMSFSTRVPHTFLHGNDAKFHTHIRYAVTSRTFATVDSSSYTNTSDSLSVTYGSGARSWRDRLRRTPSKWLTFLPQTRSLLSVVRFLADPISGLLGLACQSIASSSATPFSLTHWKWICCLYGYRYRHRARLSSCNVTVSFGWSISNGDFLLQQVSNTECVGALFRSNGPAWIFAFLKNIYSVFRYDTPAVGFAELSAVPSEMKGHHP